MILHHISHYFAARRETTRRRKLQLACVELVKSRRCLTDAALQTQALIPTAHDEDERRFLAALVAFYDVALSINKPLSILIAHDLVHSYVKFQEAEVPHEMFVALGSSPSRSKPSGE